MEAGTLPKNIASWLDHLKKKSPHYKLQRQNFKGDPKFDHIHMRDSEHGHWIFTKNLENGHDLKGGWEGVKKPFFSIFLLEPLFSGQKTL